MPTSDKAIKSPSNSTRFPEPLKAFVAWIMEQVKLVDKPATMMRECLQLGVQIRAAGLQPDKHDLYWKMRGVELAREIEGPVRQAARFCERQGYPIFDGPPNLLEELEQTRLFQQQLDARLASIERLLTQLAQGGAVSGLSSRRENGSVAPFSTTEERTTVQSIDGNEADSTRLGFDAGISL